MSDNVLTLVCTLTGGRDGADPIDLRYTPAGLPVATFRVGHKPYVPKGSDRTAEWVNMTCKCFGSLAENFAASLSKGDRLILTGRIEEESWEKDGQKRSSLRFVVEEGGPSVRFDAVTIERNERRT